MSGDTMVEGVDVVLLCTIEPWMEAIAERVDFSALMLFESEEEDDKSVVSAGPAVELAIRGVPDVRMRVESGAR